jgi:hypothetical protein
VEHAYPEMGALVPGAIEVLKDCVARGSKLVLFTVRDGKELEDAVRLLQDNGVALHAVNRNDDVPSTSPKPYYDVLIDDRALGCPMRAGITVANRMCVDWALVAVMLGLEGASWH